MIVALGSRALSLLERAKVGWFPVFVSLVLMACAHDTAPKAVVTPNAASSASDPDTSPPPGTIQTAGERDIDAGEVRLHVRIAGDEHAPRTLLVSP